MMSAKIWSAGKSELKLFILVMLVTAAIGAFVSNTGSGSDVAHRCQFSFKRKHECQPSAHAVSIRKQYGGNDDFNRNSP